MNRASAARQRQQTMVAAATLLAAALTGCSMTGQHKPAAAQARVQAKNPSPAGEMRGPTPPVQPMAVIREPAPQAAVPPIRQPDTRPAVTPPTPLAAALFAAGATEEAGPTFVFQKKAPPARGPSPSLYEDAITLGKLRAKLKAVPGLPPSVAAKSTVSDGWALISVPANCPPDPLATAARASLEIGGVRAARVVIR